MSDGLQQSSSSSCFTDEDWMRQALALAMRAEAQNEVPVGALLVKDNKLLGEGWNQPIGRCDPTAHAEIMAIRATADAVNNYRLPGTTLYVTLEPCAMCVGAIIHARISRLVFGAVDPKTGAVGSVLDLINDEHFNHKVVVSSGVLATECGDLLKRFFKKRR